MGGYFENKVAAVTGAASGLGLGITESLLARGAGAVFMGDLKEENLTRESSRLSTEYSWSVASWQSPASMNASRAPSRSPASLRASAF